MYKLPKTMHAAHGCIILDPHTFLGTTYVNNVSNHESISREKQRLYPQAQASLPLKKSDGIIVVSVDVSRRLCSRRHYAGEVLTVTMHVSFPNNHSCIFSLGWLS